MNRAMNHAWLAVLASSFSLHAMAAVMDPALEHRMAQHPGPHEVIVTFKDMNDVDELASTLGISVIRLETLPMAAAVLSEVQIAQIAQWGSVASIYYNAPLEYSNFTSGEITGGHFVHDNYGVRGAGSTIAVLDSGIDATHPDLALGDKTVQNVKILGDLGLAGGVSVFLEGQPNSDTTSGHGTHVAGTVAGSGMASASDERRPFYYDGIAPDAHLVGLGAGEGLSILYALLGFDYAIANKDRFDIDIITNSWGGGDGNAFDPNNPINQASYAAYTHGMVVTFAASNSGPDEDTLNQYAIAPWVINVAAGDSGKQLADFSSRGVDGDFFKHPDITAPGNLITSTRAPNTAVGALGPLVDPNHPEYTLRYHTISGTSMATPFVAGTAALLLQVNPELSPDQVEDVIRQSAEPMPGYAFHEVGDGYIDVRAATDLAQSIAGTRAAFLAGDTQWSSQGPWNSVSSSSELLLYDGRWKSVQDGSAEGGSYHRIDASRGGSAFVRYVGSNVKLVYPTGPQGGLADVFIDGRAAGRISFWNDNVSFGHVSAFSGNSEGDHVLELRAINDMAYLDELQIDGVAYPVDAEFVETTVTHTGFMGPSVTDLQVHTIQFEVGPDVRKIRAQLAWDGLDDLDLYLKDVDGNTVASGATLNNPEMLEFSVPAPGIYTYEVTGFASVATNWTLDSTITTLVSNQ